jgi:hypothetical protein
MTYGVQYPDGHIGIRQDDVNYQKFRAAELDIALPHYVLSNRVASTGAWGKSVYYEEYVLNPAYTGYLAQQAAQVWPNNVSAIQADVNRAPPLISNAGYGQTQNFALNYFTWRGAQYFFVPSGWSAGGGGWAKLDAANARAFGGYPFNYPSSTTQSADGYLFNHDPTWEIGPPGPGSHTSYTPGVSPGRENISGALQVIGVGAVLVGAAVTVAGAAAGAAGGSIGSTVAAASPYEQAAGAITETGELSSIGGAGLYETTTALNTATFASLGSAADITEVQRAVPDTAPNTPTATYTPTEPTVIEQPSTLWNGTVSNLKTALGVAGTVKTAASLAGSLNKNDDQAKAVKAVYIPGLMQKKKADGTVVDKTASNDLVIGLVVAVIGGLFTIILAKALL